MTDLVIIILHVLPFNPYILKFVILVCMHSFSISILVFVVSCYTNSKVCIAIVTNAINEIGVVDEIIDVVTRNGHTKEFVDVDVVVTTNYREECLELQHL